MQQTPTNPERQQSADHDGHPESIRWVSKQLRNREKYLQQSEAERELRGEILAFLRAVNQHQATSMLDHVESELEALRRHEDGEGRVQYYKMRRPKEAGIEDGPEHFPDECQGCPNYASACPLFSMRTAMNRRQELQDDLEGEPVGKIKQQYGSLATKHDCHQIPRILDDFETIASLFDWGLDLYVRAINATDGGPVDPEQYVPAKINEALDEQAAAGGS